ncbi:MAG: hypothetical protein JST16_18505, partial [Bdellovibrionales bacterium]|nr:hypothetical protein [Bdellovibrionales bacterium]
MSEKPLPSVAHYEPVATPSIPLDSAGNSLVNLYVYLPTPKKFVLFIPAGEKMTITRKIALERHVVPALFIRSTGEDSSPVVENKASESLLDHAVIGAEGASTLRSIFHKIMSPEIMEGDSKLAVEAFRGVADEMVSIIAPESADFKERLLENAQHLWVMNDAAAISTLAVIFAVANNFDSQKSLRDVIYASMVMDLPLVGFTPEVLSQFYVNPSSLPAETVEKIQDHPRQAFRVAKHALRFFSESALDLIFNH